MPPTIRCPLKSSIYVLRRNLTVLTKPLYYKSKVHVQEPKYSTPYLSIISYIGIAASMATLPHQQPTVGHFSLLKRQLEVSWTPEAVYASYITAPQLPPTFLPVMLNCPEEVHKATSLSSLAWDESPYSDAILSDTIALSPGLPAFLPFSNNTYTLPLEDNINYKAGSTFSLSPSFDDWKPWGDPLDLTLLPTIEPYSSCSSRSSSNCNLFAALTPEQESDLFNIATPCADNHNSPTASALMPKEESELYNIAMPVATTTTHRPPRQSLTRAPAAAAGSPSLPLKVRPPTVPRAHRGVANHH